jgi:hypothetical protein
VRYVPCNTSPERSFANNVQPDSASGLIDHPSSEIALDPISASEQQHCFVLFATQADRDWPDASRLPAGLSELDCAMLGECECYEVSVGSHISAAALEKQVRLSGELAGFRAEERLANRAQWELCVESAFRIEADLAGKDGAVTEAPSRLEGRGVEPGRPPPEAKRIICVA